MMASAREEVYEISEELHILPIRGIGEISPGTDLGIVIYEAMQTSQLALQRGDILVVTQKIVSKAEGRIVNLEEVQPSEFAGIAAVQSKKDAQHLEVVLRESRRIAFYLSIPTALPTICAGACNSSWKKIALLISLSLFLIPGGVPGATDRSIWQ